MNTSKYKRGQYYHGMKILYVARQDVGEPEEVTTIVLENGDVYQQGAWSPEVNKIH